MSDEGFADFESFDDPPIRLPYKGKVYELAPVDAQFATWLIAARSGAKTPLAKMSDEAQIRRLLGPAYDLMLKDRVPQKFLLRAELVAITEVVADASNPGMGRKAAESVWRTGVDPEAVAALVAASEAQEVDHSPTSSSMDEDEKTPTPASMSHTTYQGKPQGRRPKASPSQTSSGSGGRSKRTGESSTMSTSETT